jgi:fluoride exporter
LEALVILALAVGLAGAVGAVARYLLDGAVQDRSSGLFPLGTLTVNAVGSIILGCVAGLSLRYAGAQTAETIIGTGFCGALTTWSTASWETVRLAQEGAAQVAVIYTLANLVTSLVAGGLGLLLVLR